MDMPLLDWLETYTFPCEAKFKDLQFAKEVQRIHCSTGGSVACCWFASCGGSVVAFAVDTRYNSAAAAAGAAVIVVVLLGVQCPRQLLQQTNQTTKHNQIPTHPRTHFTPKGVPQGGGEEFVERHHHLLLVCDFALGGRERAGEDRAGVRAEGPRGQGG